MSAPAAGLRFGRIRITAHAIEEVVSRTPLVSIRRAEIRRVVFRRSIVAEHPALFVALGVACCAVGAWGIIGLLRSGFVLAIETDRGTRKLWFGKEIDPKLLPAFLDAAGEAGIAVERG